MASVIAKFTDREFGTKSDVITRRSADRMGLTNYGKAYDDGATMFVIRALLRARGQDVVHVHSLDRVMPYLKVLFGSKPIIVHYHGTDILGRWAEKRPRWSRADFLAYSTTNLSPGSPPQAVLAADPVDTDIFRDLGDHGPDSALHVEYGATKEATEIARSMGLQLTVLDRAKNPVLYSDMPALLNRYEYYIDVKRAPGRDGDVIHSMSKTGLEALSCGCKVIDWAGKVNTGLPNQHDPRTVAKFWSQTYSSLLTAR